MQPIRTFNVTPSIPLRLQNLPEIAYNLRWAWNLETIELFRRLDRDLWESTYHNPIQILGIIQQSKLEEAAKDDAFIAHLDKVYDSLKTYMTAQTWYDEVYGKGEKHYIAYFSAEFGVTECIPIYSGGLGILAGDYLKSASDLGLPMVGVGLLYQQGYFSQYLNADGWQQESYPDNDFYNMPFQLEMQGDGTPITITVDYPDGPVKAHIWRAQIGRVPLYMLDTNISENTRPKDRDITDQLYAADQDIRIRQEIMLGIGGVKALDALGIEPVVYHINEGHPGFLALERSRCLMHKNGLSFSEAKELAVATNIFTSHTSVPTGIDTFPQQLMERYFRNYSSSLGISFDDFMALGRQHPGDNNENFSMSVLAIRHSAQSNGVSKLHGMVSRKIWNNIWPGVPEEEVPIGYVSSGIHIRSWVSGGMAELYDRYLGPRWSEEPSDPSIWKKVNQIPADELWRTHERRRERLIAFARNRLIRQFKRLGMIPSEIDEVSEILNPEALTIGFARRITTYKRATLILQDIERLIQIVGNKERPVQIIYAGKAHPNDMPAKELIKQIIYTVNHTELRKHIVFIEDYDMNVARYLIQGVDLWLSTPIRLNEASSTSGMKSAVNGGINMSILDGWWYDAYRPEIGWAIGLGEEYDNREYQDAVESRAIYEMLEKEVIPMFYNRGNDGLPQLWINRMKASMSAVGPLFNTNRMVYDYVEQFYHPGTFRFRVLADNDFAQAKEQAAWKARIRKYWSGVRIDGVEMEEAQEVRIGDKVKVKAHLYLGELTPDDVAVEVYQGLVDSQGRIVNAWTIRMNVSVTHGNGKYTFEIAIPCNSSGLHGYNIRILPSYGELTNPYEMGLITWAP